MKGEYVPAKVGDSFGPSWSTHWFKVSIDVPTGPEWVGKEVVLAWNGGMLTPKLRRCFIYVYIRLRGDDLG